MSMFSFQAIHNALNSVVRTNQVVYRLCQCSLFKQFTTYGGSAARDPRVVYRLCQCSLFKQFTTGSKNSFNRVVLFIDYVNVLFSSNSQPTRLGQRMRVGCLSIMSMFSFQAIHNPSSAKVRIPVVVYRLCQCSLFKQFTTFRNIIGYV